MNSNKTKKNSGITLIALVITIIVMLILVAVTISMAINGGLFEYARNAGTQTNEAVANEQLLANGQVTIGGTTYESIDEYIETTRGETETETETETVPNLEEKFSTIYETNTPITQGSYTAVIPKGFAVGTSSGINTIAGGLVITDKVNSKGQSIGNEFVWIPVTVTETDTETSIASFYRSKWEADDANGGKRGTAYTATSSFKEPLSSGGYTNEVAEYNEMLKSVYENKGFYIGRYEAGIKTTESPRTATTTGSSNMVVQRDCYPYNFVGWGNAMNDYTSNVIYNTKTYKQENGANMGQGALALSKALYESSDVGVTSTLCYSIQWDAMLDFIKDANHNVINSITWGNFSNNPWTITRKTAKYTASPKTDTTWTLIDDETNDKKEKTSSEGILLTTGASDEFASKNIFDVAGNCYEWTNEAYSFNLRVTRGGHCYGDGDSYPASTRNYSFSYFCIDRVGFRPVLYIS